jgi:hypothetical protein
MADTLRRWVGTTTDIGVAANWNPAVAPSVAATGVLTLTGLPLDTETVVISTSPPSTKTYTFQTTLTDSDGNVKIGADADESIANLVAAITLGAGAGTKYAASMTLHPSVTAAEGAGDTMDVTAKVKGASGNAIATTETLTNGSFGAATLEGGTQWASSDKVLVDGTGSQVSMTEGMDQASPGVALIRWDVTEAYTGDIGANGSPLNFANLDQVTFRGQGSMYYKSSGGDKVIVDSPNLVDAMTLSGKIIGLYVKRGRANVTADAVFTSGSSCVALGFHANIVIVGTTWAPTTLSVIEGKIDTGMRAANAGDWSTIEVNGGELLLRTLENNDHFIQTGGAVRFNVDAGDAPASPWFDLRAGVADFQLARERFDSFADGSYIGPAMTIIDGPVTTDAVLSGATNMLDLRVNFP